MLPMHAYNASKINDLITHIICSESKIYMKNNVKLGKLVNLDMSTDTCVTLYSHNMLSQIQSLSKPF